MNKLSIVFLMLVLLATGGMAQPLVVTSVTPSQGAVGSTVTINGSGFGIQLTDQIIYFGAVRAEQVVSVSTTHITVKVPAGATYAPISVLRWYTGQCVLSPQPFNVTFGSGSTRALDNNSYVATTPISLNAQSYCVAFGDLSQDLKTDMVVSDAYNGKVYLYKNTSTTGTNTFAPPIELSTGDGPRAVTLADIDNDGDLDILVANYLANSLSIFTNKIATGSSEWWPQKFERTDFTTGARPSDVDVQDVDRDGRLDVVVVNSWASSVSVYRNTATTMNIIDANSLAAPVDFGMGGANALALDDMNGDGKPDMIVANYGTNDLAYRINTSSPGNISFDNSSDTSIPGDAYDVKTADLDGDGKPDVIVGQSGGAVSILHNASTLANIVFDTRTDLPVATEPRYVAISDLNGDGKPDIVTANTNANDNTGTISLFQNKSSSGSLSTGSFSSAVTLPARNANYSVAVANIDNDGQPDIAALDINRVTLFRNALDFVAPAIPSGLRASAGNQQSAVVWNANTESDLTSYKVYGGTTPNPTTLLATVNAPGNSYRHTGLSNNVVYYYRIIAVDASGNESSPTADVTVTPVVAPAPPTVASISPAFARIGSTVTVTGTNFNTTASQNSVYFGATRAAVTAASATQLTVTVPSGASYQPVTVTNLANGLSARSPHPFAVKIMAGTGRDFAPESYNASLRMNYPGNFAESTAIGDLDDDGKPDLVVGLHGKILLYRNISASGDLTASAFSSPVVFDYAQDGVSSNQIVIDDIDGDGKQDVVIAVGGWYDGFLVLRNTGNSISINSFTLSYFDVNTWPASAMAVADIDGDGLKDVVISDGYYSDRITVCRNTSLPGSMTFDFASIGGFGAEVTSLALSDLDGDGKPDLIAASNTENFYSVFRNISSPGSVTAASFDARVNVSITSPVAVRGLVAADMDGDGKTDLVTASEQGKKVTIFHNTSSAGSIMAASFAATDFSTAPSAPDKVGVADLDGDGKPDMAVMTGDNSSHTYTLSIYRNKSAAGSISAGSFQERQDVAATSKSGAMDIGDLNGDGAPDIAVSQWSYNDLVIYRNNMDFTPPTIAAVRAVPGNAKNTVSWQPGAESDAASYNVYGGTSPGASTLLATVEYPQTLYAHTGLVNGTTYYYRVTATDNLGNVSDPSSEVSATPVNILVPSITQVTPSSSNIGTAVTITGAHFGATPGNNVVYFGATRATVTAASATQLTVTVPAGATYAPISVLNTTTGLTGSSPASFAPTFGGDQNANFNSHTFGPMADLNAGSAPVAVVTGDIDGDGKSDMVVVNDDGNSVSLYRNTAVTGSVSDDSFAAPVDMSTGDHPVAAALADLDNDGKQDLIVVHLDAVHLMYLYRNTATAGELTAASFAAPVTIDTGSPATALAVGDVDGDGKRDIVVVHRLGNFDITVFRNMTSPGSMAAADFEYGVSLVPGGEPLDATLTDLDGDGALDLAVAHGNSFSVYRNTATPGSISNTSFAARASFNVPRASGLVAGDLDRDGKQDVAVISYNNRRAVVFRNTASQGSLTTNSFAAGIDLPVDDYPSDVAIGDIDGDGRQDLVVGFNVNYYLMRAFRNISQPGTITNNSFRYVDFETGNNGSSAIALGDVDSDGQPDLLWVSQHGHNVSGFRNTVDFTAPATPQNVTATGGDAIVTIRLTPNTEEDLYSYVVYGGTTPGDEQMLAVYEAAGDSFTMTGPGEGLFSNGTTYYIKVVAVDTYGNKSPFSAEIAVTPNVLPGTIVTAVAPGSAVAGTSVTVTGENFNTTPANNLVHFGVTRAEVTQASATQLKVTVPVSATYGPVSVTNIEAGRSATSPIPFAGKVGAGLGQDFTENSFDPAVKITNTPWIMGMAMGDIDGDGKPDLVAATYDTDPPVVSIYRNISSSGSITAGSFAEPVAIETGWYPLHVALADLDNDGKKDLVVTTDESTLHIYHNTSSPGGIDADSFAEPEVLNTEWTNGLSIADIDLDGKQDIIRSTQDGIFVHRNRSTPGNINAEDLGSYVRVGDHITYRGLAVGDLNGDGKPEIVGTDYYASTVIVYQNLSTMGNISGEDFVPVAFGTGAAPAPVALADIDRDGKTDVLVGALGETIISILRNTWAAGAIDESSFAPKADITSTNTVFTLAVDDLDGDGRPDITSIHPSHGDITAFRNLSSPGSITAESFGAKIDFSMGNVQDSYAMLLGDLDSDGKSDMIVPNGTENAIQIFHNAMDLAAPATPVNLVATAGVNDIVLTWDANTDINLASYKVYGGTTPEPTTLLTTIDAPATTYTHAGVEHGTLYYYRISAVKTFGYESEKTADVRAAIRVSATITFPALAGVAYGVADFAPGATSTNTASPVLYASSNAAVATIVDGKIHVTGTGTTTITASQPQDETHFAATNVTRDLVVSKGSQTIAFLPLADKKIGDNAFTLTAASTSALSVNFSTTTTELISITNNTVTLLKPGRASITANQPGDDRYTAATSVTHTFCIVPARPAVTLNLDNPETPVLTSNAASGNQWFLNGTAIAGATQASHTVSAQGIYAVKVTADDCASELSAAMPLVITATLPAEATTLLTVYPNPAAEKISVTLPGKGNKRLSITGHDGKVVYELETSEQAVIINVADYAAGVYLVSVSSAPGNEVVRFVKK